MEGQLGTGSSAVKGRQENSIVTQVEHLMEEINKLDESIACLVGCLDAVLSAPEDSKPEEEADRKEQSSLMDKVIGLTCRVRRMNSAVRKVTQRIQI